MMRPRAFGGWTIRPNARGHRKMRTRAETGLPRLGRRGVLLRGTARNDAAPRRHRVSGRSPARLLVALRAFAAELRRGLLECVRQLPQLLVAGAAVALQRLRLAERRL